MLASPTPRHNNRSYACRRRSNALDRAVLAGLSRRTYRPSNEGPCETQQPLTKGRKAPVIMAPQATILRANEVQALAERLRARGESRLLASDENKHLSADLRLAAKVIAALAAELPAGFAVTIDDCEMGRRWR